MAGKIDSTAHAAAFARISEPVKHQSEILAHLDQIVNVSDQSAGVCASRHCSRDDLTNISPEAHAFVMEQLKDFRFGPMFTPPGNQETIVLPGYHGGALLGGASFDPDTEWLYLNHNEIPWSTS